MKIRGWWGLALGITACGGGAASAPATTTSGSETSASCTGEVDARPEFEAHRSEMEACYQARVREFRDPVGQLRLTVRVAANGDVDEIAMHGSLDDERVRSCVRSVAQSMHFPAVTGGSCAVVVVPYSFTPS